MLVQERVKKIAEAITKADNLQLVDLKVQSQGRMYQLRLTIDKDGGVLLDECAKVNRLLDKQIQEEKIILGNYTIEVVSPGLDREFSSENDFKKHLGKEVTVVTREPIENNQIFTGVVECVDNEKIGLQIRDKQQLTIGLNNIKKAKLKIRW